MGQIMMLQECRYNFDVHNYCNVLL